MNGTKPTCQVAGCGKTTPPGTVVCQECADKLVMQLLVVPGLALALEEAHRKALRFSTTSMVPHPSATEQEESPIPFDPRASAALALLVNTLTSWADLIAWSWGAHRPLDTPSALARWLAYYVTWMRSWDRGPEAVERIGAAVRHAFRVVDRPADRLYAGPCTAVLQPEGGGRVECGADLYALPRETVVRCELCGATYVLEDRRQWLLGKAEDMLLPAGELARAIDGLGVDVTPELIRKWAERGRLTAHGTTRSGRPVYRVGDVRDLVLATATRRAPQRP